MKVRGQSQLGHQAPRHVQKAKVRKKEVAQMQTSHKTGHRAIDGRPPVGPASPQRLTGDILHALLCNAGLSILGLLRVIGQKRIGIFCGCFTPVV